MEKSNLIALLRTFSVPEWKAFDKYLHSPYLNSNKRIITFYTFLKKHHPDFTHKRLAKPFVFTAVFPEKAAFDDKLLRATMSDLHKAALRFLAYQEFGKNPLLQKGLQAQHFAKKDDFKKFKNTSLDILREKEAASINDMDYFFEKFQTYNNLYFYPGKTGIKTSPEFLEKAHQNLQHFSTLANDRILIEKADRNYRFISPANKKNSAHLSPDIFKLNKQLLDLLENRRGDHHYFLEIKNTYICLLDKLDLLTQKFIFQKLQNYINREFISGKKNYLNELLNLYKLGLKKDLFFYRSTLNDNVFINIAVTGSSCKDFKWTDEFINRYAPYVALELRDDAVNFANASLKFHQGLFEQSIDLLQLIPPKNIYFKIRVAPLSIRCYYELSLTNDSYVKLLRSKITAFEKFLSRKKFLSEKWTVSYKNFCKAILVLIQLKKPIGLNGVAIKNKIKKIEEEKNVINRSWILDKLNGLK